MGTITQNYLKRAHSGSKNPGTIDSILINRAHFTTPYKRRVGAREHVMI